MDTTELASRIREVAYLEGDFTLRSGLKSRYYLDKYLFETQPDVLGELARRFVPHCADANRVAGAELGGVPLAAAVSLAAGKPFVIVRNAKKGYGTSKMYEGALNPGDRVVLLEDVTTTGGQILEAARTLADAGAEVVRIVAVIDRGTAGAAIESAGYAFESLLSKQDLGIA